MPEGRSSFTDVWTPSAGAGIGFMVAFGESFQIVGAFSSSPWTISNVGADDEKAKSARNYLALAIMNNMLAYGLIGSMLTQSCAPLVGTVMANVEIALVYRHAISKAKASNSDGSKWGW